MQPAKIAPRDRLIVALDLPSVEAAEAMIGKLGDAVTFYKIGYQLAYAGGLPLVSRLAGTVLTSYDDGDLHAAGYRLNVSDLVEARAQQAQVLGVDGIVCSAEEAAHLHKIVGHQMHLVTPGIRPAGAATGDQKRIMTPARAIAAGADYLVVGRPITEAADPKAAADAIQAEIKQALA